MDETLIIINKARFSAERNWRLIPTQKEFEKMIVDAHIKELEKRVPEEVKNDLHEMCRIQNRIFYRMAESKAIPTADVERFNALCYKHFGKLQDGAEFVKEEAPKEKAAQTQGNKIPYTERKRVYEEAIDRWGIPAQLQMVIEEMSELTKELCKNFRGANNLDKIADECADVTIMLEQLRLIFNLNEEVCRHMDQKVARLKERLQAKPKAPPRELTEKEIESKEAWESMRARLEERLKGRTEP